VAILLTGAAPRRRISHIKPGQRYSPQHMTGQVLLRRSHSYAWGIQIDRQFGRGVTDRGFVSLAQGYEEHQGEAGSTACNSAITACSQTGCAWRGGGCQCFILSKYSGNRIGNTVPVLGGTASYSDNIFASGTVRGRIGYAPGTGSLCDRRLCLDSENYLLAPSTDSSFQQRTGWGRAGVEGPLLPIGL